jgi:iron complex outermembrane receptor protein
VKKLLLLAFAAMFAPLLVLAQFSIAGKVIDKDQHALPGASVTLSNTLLSTQTDNSGNFTFRNLKAGDYTLHVTYLGFNTTDRKVTLNGNMDVNIELETGTFLADEVIVESTRASENSATAYRNMNKAEIESNNAGQDLPYLLNQTPSVVVNSDAGAGFGYTGIRIRGSDGSRINVTVNGIPYNDAESQGSYFVDVPDFASSIDNIQIQRGVGTSTNGAGAFGASINIQTNVRRDTAYAELNNSFGSYATWKNTVNVGTGLINKKFSVDARLSRIKSNGYIDRASSYLKSYFLSGAYYGKDNLLRINVFSGSEKTYQAWNGIPENLLVTNRTFNEFTYDDQTDNYIQDHYQLLYSHAFSKKLAFNGALHYTYGRGYYEEYKKDQDFSDYGLKPLTVGTTTINSTDLIRRRWLNNDFYGTTYSLIYTPESNLNFTLGGAYNEYNGGHYGEIIWSKYASNSTIRQRYYDNNAFKTDFNIYGKAAFHPGSATLFADLQYRRVGYSFVGFDRNLKNTAQKDILSFFNPKAGISYQINDISNVYASFAVGNKEPNREDYVNSTPDSRPKPENLKDLEAGYRFNGPAFTAGINGFAMFYKDQLILTGEINDVGEYTRQNVPDSYRAGIELDGKIQVTKNITWGATASWSRNKIKSFSEYIDNYDTGNQLKKDYKNPDIAFSPAFVGSSELAFMPFKNTGIAFLSKYVGKEYLDNTSHSDRKIDAFFVNDLRLYYKASSPSFKNIGLSLQINNIFSQLYEANGYTFSYISGGTQSTENYYFPQATRNFLFSLSLRF